METPPSILIVDDELENFDVIETMLMVEGYQLHYAANGVQALAFLNTYQPDLILMDIMMPGMDGIEVCQRITTDHRWKHIPILVITALNSKDDLVKCLESGATDFLSKPVHRAELHARVRSMLRIKQQHDELQTLLQFREDMVSMVVHDLRNPLSSIIMSTELLRIAETMPEKCQDKLERIAIASYQLQLQIDSLLMMAKIEAGKMVLSASEIDLCAVCMSALSSFEAIAEQKRVSLVSYLPEPGGSISVDVNVFRRMMDNLLSNAIKFSPAKSTVTLRAAYVEWGGAIVQVVDEGPGINAATKQSIFEKYEIGQLIKGVDQTGLGLAFVKMAIEAHGGHIEVEDNYPQGSIFTLHLTASA